MSNKKKNTKKAPPKKSVKNTNDKKKIFLISAIAVVLLVGITLLSAFLTRPGEPTNTVVIKVKNYGDIVIELDPDAAPITVENFKKLVSERFYRKSTFHRIVDGFVIQGGASAKGKKAATIKGEFAENGVANPLAHERGVISMARLGNDPNSASSQFFIVLETSYNNTLSLDGKYAAFGRVIEGMDVVDAIAAVRTNYYTEAPLQKIQISRVYFK